MTLRRCISPMHFLRKCTGGDCLFDQHCGRSIRYVVIMPLLSYFLFNDAADSLRNAALRLVEHEAKSSQCQRNLNGETGTLPSLRSRSWKRERSGLGCGTVVFTHLFLWKISMTDSSSTSSPKDLRNDFWSPLRYSTRCDEQQRTAVCHADFTLSRPRYHDKVVYLQPATKTQLQPSVPTLPTLLFFWS